MGHRDNTHTVSNDTLINTYSLGPSVINTHTRSCSKYTHTSTHNMTVQGENWQNLADWPQTRAVPPFDRTMRAANVGICAFSCLLAVSLAVAAVAMQPGVDEAPDHILASPASTSPSRSPQPWATRYATAMPLPSSRILAPSDLPQAENGMLDTLKLSHLLTLDSRRRVSADTSLRAIATKNTPATDPAMAATPSTCNKCQWQ